MEGVRRGTPLQTKMHVWSVPIAEIRCIQSPHEQIGQTHQRRLGKSIGVSSAQNFGRALAVTITSRNSLPATDKGGMVPSLLVRGVFCVSGVSGFW